MKRAISYLRGNRVFTHASSKTTSGVWVLEPPASVAEVSDQKLLGQQVMQALDASRAGIPHPTSWRGIFDPILQLAGVKSWSTFVKSARCVEIELEAERLAYLATENLGAEGGFNTIERMEVISALTDTQALGANLLAAFEESK